MCTTPISYTEWYNINVMSFSDDMLGKRRRVFSGKERWPGKMEMGEMWDGLALGSLRRYAGRQFGWVRLRWVLLDAVRVLSTGCFRGEVRQGSRRFSGLDGFPEISGLAE